ncbi:unnamed protein product [Anisakis simplex]|uniref:Uncharacterized protein n=1 Tax=Anisakis simplex TaxID=6269 RepID=A0A3P6PCF1_ANISI|nr:unnamed protein product [Anisakis simplex]
MFLFGVYAQTAHGYRTPFNRLPKSSNPSLDDRQQIVWINTTYQAEDNGVDIARLPQCKAWQKWWTLEVRVTFTFDEFNF